MYTIATLDDLKARLNLTTSTDDARLLAALQAASAQIERGAARRFCPRVESRRHDIEPTPPGELLLDDDLLELTGLADASGELDIADVLLLPGGESASVLRRFGGTAFVWDDSPVQAVTVSGVWGWHDRPGAMWRDSGAALLAVLDATATTISTGDSSDADASGESPRFKTGHLLRIGGEYLRVTGINRDAHTLAVMRGVHGTDAASHSAGVRIETYQPPADIAMLTLRWAAWLYKEPDNRTGAGIPPVLWRALASLRRIHV